MHPDCFKSNGESKAVANLRARTASYLEKWLKDCSEIVFRHARPLITNAHLNARARCLIYDSKIHQHLGTSFRKPDAVANDIFNRTSQRGCMRRQVTSKAS